MGWDRKIERVAVADWAPAATGVIGVDFETFYTGKYSVSEMGVYAYVHDRRFNAYLVSVTDGRQCCVCHPSAFPWGTIVGREWVSHNRDFDRAVFFRLQTTDRRLQTLDVMPSAWYCTAALCAYLQLPRDLAGAVREVFGVEISKAVRKKSKGKDARQGSLNLCGEADELNDYAAGDAEWCMALWNELEGQWPAHERRLFELTSAMGRNGLPVDWTGVEANRMELAALVQSMSAELPWSPSLSIPKFQAACSALGVVPPKSTAVGDGDYMDWLKRNNGSVTATWVRHMQRIRSANRTEKVLESMEERRMSGERLKTEDGRRKTEAISRGGAETQRQGCGTADRMAFELKYFGCTTGRWSGGGGLNLQNFNRKEAEGVDLRGTITAPAGKLLAAVDYAQIESRVLLYLAGDTETLELFRSNPEADAYEIHARATMGWSPVGETADGRLQTGGDERPRTADRRRLTADGMWPGRGNVVIGCDVAKHTDFTVLVAMDAVTGRCFAMERFNQLDWPIQKERIEAFVRRHRGRLIMDASGVGDPVYDELKQRIADVEAFKFTATSKVALIQRLIVAVEQREVSWPCGKAEIGKAESRNGDGLCSEGGDSLAEARRRGEGDWEVLTAEMKRYEYVITANGHISYNAPSGYQDDCVIALALANWGRWEAGNAGVMMRVAGGEARGLTTKARRLKGERVLVG